MRTMTMMKAIESSFKRSSGRCAGAPPALAGLVSALALLAVLALLPSAAGAEGTPTPLPFAIHLPVIMKENAPAQPATLVLQQGEQYSGALDTFISIYTPASAHGFEPLLGIRWDRGRASADESALLSYNLQAVPQTATVQKATFSLYTTGRSNINSLTVGAFEVLRPWRPDQATWYSPTLSLPWAVMGCNGIDSDRRATAEDSTGIPGVGVWIDLDVTAMVQRWVSNPGANFGMIVRPAGDGQPSVRYEVASAKHPDPGLRPRLTLTYINLPVAPTVVVPTATASPTPSATSSVPTATATRTATPSPTWTPVPSWWNVNYAYRRQLTVQAAPGYAVAAGYAVSLTLETDALTAAGKLSAGRQDWRIVAWNGWGWSEIARDAAGSAETWFALQRPLSGGGSDVEYYVYYGNPGESTAAQDERASIYTFYDDFDGYDASKWPWPRPSGVEVAGGVITITAYNPSGEAADSCPGAYDCMLSQQTFGVGYQVEQRARHPDFVAGTDHDADQGFSDDGHSHEVKLRSYNVANFQRVNRDATGQAVAWYGKPADTNWHVFRVTRLNANSILFQVDDGPVEQSTTHVPLMPLSVHIRAYSAEPYEPSRNVVDWIKVRPVVAVEPLVAWGSEESAVFTAPAR